jgi:hypothetical protein
MNSVYGIIFDKVSKKTISQKFEKIGWEVRKSGFYEYEIKSSWAELNIEGENQILINGEIKIDHFSDLEKLLVEFDLKYSLEIYDNEDKLIKTVANTVYN